jgi:hypothetical protein
MTVPGEPLSDFVCSQSGDTNYFLPAVLTGSYGNGSAGHLQEFRQELDAGFVGSAFDRRRRQRQFDRIANFAGDGILFGAGVDFDGEGGAKRSVANLDHA